MAPSNYPPVEYLAFLSFSPCVTLDTYLLGKLMVLGGITETKLLFLFNITHKVEKTIYEYSF